MAAAPTYWVHDLSPFVLRFGDDWGIRYYGLAYVLGFAATWLLLRAAHDRGRIHLPPTVRADLLFAVILGVFVGGRLGYFLLYRFHLLAEDPLVLLRIWEGGMASHGGFVGVLVAMVWTARTSRVPFWSLADAVTVTAPIGILLGRIANFINGELWGRITDVPWAVIFPASAAPGTPVHLIAPRHPSQLYEAAAEGLLLGAYLQLRFWLGGTARTRPGVLAGEFLALYAVGRIACEAFREPDAPLLFGLNRGQFYSLAVLAAGVVVILWRWRAASPGPAAPLPPGAGSPPPRPAHD